MDYNFRFVIEEISNINDKEQSMTIHMYFAVMWLEPRLVINQSAVEWDEDRYIIQEIDNILINVNEISGSTIFGEGAYNKRSLST